jgi:hypothetical protein
MSVTSTSIGRAVEAWADTLQSAEAGIYYRARVSASCMAKGMLTTRTPIAAQ